MRYLYGILALSHKATRITYRYHHAHGITVPKCHRLCASISAYHGGKSRSSRLIARMIQTTIIAGQRVHVFPVFWYRTTLKQIQRVFWIIPTTILAIILYV
jgi:hypothetical protein